MKNIIKGAFTLLLMLAILVSCSFSEKEADVYATVDTPTVIYGIVGESEMYNTNRVPPTITITLHNGSLSSDIPYNTSVIGWVKNSEIFSSFGGLAVLGNHTKGATEIKLYFSSLANGIAFSKPTNERIKLQIPASYIKSSASNKDRISPVVVDTDNLKAYAVVPENGEPIGRMLSASSSQAFPLGYVSSVGTSGFNIGAFGMVGDEVNWEGRIELNNATFKPSDELKQGSSIKGWFSPEVEGIDYIVKDDVSTQSKYINFTITGTIAETKPLTFYTVKIPGAYTNEGKDVPVFNLANALVYVKEGPSKLVITESQEIKGTVSLSEDTVDTSFTISALGGATTFQAISEGTDVSSWFSPLIPGLSYTVSAVTALDREVTVNIKGKPERSTTHNVEIIVPSSVLYNVRGDITVDGTVKYNIEKSTDFDYDWKLYDLASFGTVDLKVESPNKALTKAYNGTDELTFGDGNVLASDTTSAVSFPSGLSRRGYKLAGFNRIGDNGIVSTRTGEGELDFAVGKEVTVDSSSGAISFNLAETDKGEVVRLYAIWDVDLAAWHLKKNDDSTYNTTLDISLNAEGKNEYLPAVFDVKKAYPNDTAKQAQYYDYPYYRESVVLSKGLKVPGDPTNNYTDPEDVELNYDFAIGEQVITGYMLDELRAWNETLAEGERYTLPTMATVDPNGAALDTVNVVTYGSTYNGSWLVKEDKSDPIGSVTVTQAMVIANAMTAYYNAKKGLSEDSEGYLAPAYIVKDETTPIKKISEAITLYEATTATGASMAKTGSKGFRLPTSVEWGLAARIVPQSDYDASLTGAHSQTSNASRNYLYPQIHRSNMWSGANIIASADSNNPQADNWVWYVYNSYGEYGSATTRSTHGFLKNDISSYKRTEGWSVLDKKQNNIGVYGMSGNVWEWCDTVVGSSSRRLRGGSFYSSASNSRVGVLNINSASARYGNYGLRLARGL